MKIGDDARARNVDHDRRELARTVGALHAHRDELFDFGHRKDRHRFLDRRDALARIFVVGQDRRVETPGFAGLFRAGEGLRYSPKYVDVGVDRRIDVVNVIDNILPMALLQEIADLQASRFLPDLFLQVLRGLPAGFRGFASGDCRVEFVQAIVGEQIPKVGLVLIADRWRVVKILRRLPVGIEGLDARDLAIGAPGFIARGVVAKRGLVGLGRGAPALADARNDGGILNGTVRGRAFCVEEIAFRGARLTGQRNNQRSRQDRSVQPCRHDGYLILAAASASKWSVTG